MECEALLQPLRKNLTYLLNTVSTGFLFPSPTFRRYGWFIEKRLNDAAQLRLRWTGNCFYAQCLRRHRDSWHRLRKGFGKEVLDFRISIWELLILLKKRCLFTTFSLLRGKSSECAFASLQLAINLSYASKTKKS